MPDSLTPDRSSRALSAQLQVTSPGAAATTLPLLAVHLRAGGGGMVSGGLEQHSRYHTFNALPPRRRTLRLPAVHLRTGSRKKAV